MSYNDVDVLIKQATPDLTAHVQDNPLLSALSAGQAGSAQVAQIVLGEFHAHAAEVAAFATMAARYPVQPVSGYFVDLARLVLDCDAPLLACAEALGWGEKELRSRELPNGMRDFGSFMSWLAMRAGPAEAACAVRADLLLWCGTCAALTEELERQEAPMPQPVIDYFSLFQTAPERFIEEAREVAAYGLARGEAPALVEQGIAQVEPVLSRFWAAAVQPCPAAP